MIGTSATDLLVSVPGIVGIPSFKRSAVLLTRAERVRRIASNVPPGLGGLGGI